MLADKPNLGECSNFNSTSIRFEETSTNWPVQFDQVCFSSFQWSLSIGYDSAIPRQEEVSLFTFDRQTHMRRKVLNVGRGQDSEYWGSKERANFSLAVNCSKSPHRPLPNKCQIITFLILKTDNIAELRVDFQQCLQIK